MHALFAALFDQGADVASRVAPKPFHIASSAGRMLDVLGYASLDHIALAERAKSFADPMAWGVCELGSAVSKPMPEGFEPGTRLGFSVRACPIRRVARKGPMTRARAEVDVFLAKAWAVGPEVALDRNEVYLSWLGEELAKEGAARLVQAQVTRFSIGHLHRRTQGEERTSHRTQRPDVTFEGILEVVDSAAFGRRLARGIGRHRAFGYGMLLLKPAARR